MKKKIYFIFFLLFFFGIQGEELLKDWSYKNGYYAAAFVKAGEITDNLGVFGGIRASYIFNHILGIGVEFESLLNNPSSATQTQKDPFVNDLKIGYGGLKCDWFFFPDKIIHGSIGTLLGIGSLKTEVISSETNEIEDRFGVIEPEINGILAITKSFQLSLGISYRFLIKQNYQYIDSKELEGFNGIISLRLGSF